MSLSTKTIWYITVCNLLDSAANDLETEISYRFLTLEGYQTTRSLGKAECNMNGSRIFKDYTKD